jgi:hypothetical protein
MKQFQMISGTVTGRDHMKSLAWKNGQDALCTFDLLDQSGIAIAVVSDGCGSGENSEVGAKLASRFVANRLFFYLPRYIAGVKKGGGDPAEFRYFEDVRQDLLGWMRQIAYGLDPNLYEGVRSHFLFTLMGFVVTPHHSFIFSIGDGVYALNGKVTRLGPFDWGEKKNAPPYVGYGMFREGQYEADSKLVSFQVNEAVPTESVSSILVGTDGVADFIDAGDRNMPSLRGPKGEDVKLGPLSQFWEDDSFYVNPDGKPNVDGIRRRLALANNSTPIPDWHNERLGQKPGLLPDDTTLVVIRRSMPPKLEVKK